MAVDPTATVLPALERGEIVPDIIPPSLNFAPTYALSVLYATAAGPKEVMLGNEFTKEETQSEPIVSFAPVGGAAVKGGEQASYTLVMLDPDVPSREKPENRSFRHWVITGLKSPQVEGTARGPAAPPATQTQPAVTPYRAPDPAVGSGFHRYTFLLFVEPSGGPLRVVQDAPEHKNERPERRRWDVWNFVDRHGLKLVGGNYMTLRVD